MQITFINNDGAGFADRLEIADGTTIAQLFQERLPHGRPEDYLIRVNRQPATADQVLLPGDRISITPTKIEGAVSLPEWRARTGIRPSVSLSVIFPSPSLVSKESPWEPESGSTVYISPGSLSPQLSPVA